MADIIINCGRLKLEKFLYCYPLENFMLKYLPNWVYIQIPYIFVLRGEMVKWCKSGIKVADCVRSKIVYLWLRRADILEDCSQRVMARL